MDYRLAVFDLDGTILDTLGDLHMSVNYALAAENLPRRTLEEVREDVGNGIRNLISRSVPGGDRSDAGGFPGIPQSLQQALHGSDPAL